MNMDKLTAQVADLINSFKIPGWENSSVDEITVEPLGAGYINSTFKVSKLNNNTGADDGPSCLVFKKYGGNKMADHCEESTPINAPIFQSLLSYEVSRRGCGPKLYGITEDARLEEYLDCTTLDPKEAFKDEISADFARALAQFHSIDLPLEKRYENFLAPVKVAFEEEKDNVLDFINTCDDEKCNAAFKSLLTFPHEKEFQWISSIIDRIDHRVALSAMDPNYLNRLVRKSSPQSGNRCMLIDYDFTRYFPRGFDIGGHFVFRVIDAEDKDNKLTGLSYPSAEERRFFLIRYLEESSKVFDDFDPASIDNLNHLELESDAYAPYYALWVIFMSAGFYKMYQVEPNMYTLIDYMIDLYYTLKKNFCTAYPHLLKD